MIKRISLFSSLAVIFSFTSFLPVEKMSMKLLSKSLQSGKSITTQAEVFYKVSGSVLITHITSPVEYLVVTNGKGEFKMYDVKQNTISQAQGTDFSSENSFIYDFLNGNTNDMGLKRIGFQLKSTKVEEDMVITSWIPPVELNSKMARAEVVHENYLPIYMAFYGKKNKLLSKIFYYNYKKTGEINLPTTITEFQYMPNGDSTITKRVYSEIKINELVDSKWFDYKIPDNAKMVK
jgi:outer membrane lipoprotein-sorting protein